MESQQKWWATPGFMSGLSLDSKRTSLFAAAMKSVLPVAEAAAAPASAPVPAEPELDPQHPVMALRRNLVGKAFAMHMQASQKVPKYDDLASEAQSLFQKHMTDGMTVEIQRGLGPRFMTMHRIAMGQRNQDDPPSSYNLMTHLALQNGALLVGQWSTQGNMMARLIKETRGTLLQAAYNAQVNAKGEESTATELEMARATRRTAYGLKYSFQMTPQGGAGVVEGSYVKRLTPSLSAGIHGLLIPSQGRLMTSVSARYEHDFWTPEEEKDWQRNVDRAFEKVEKLTEDDPISAYDSCVLAAAFFKPKWVIAAMASPQQGLFELSYVKALSSSITLGTQFTLMPPPPNPTNPSPSLKAKWQIGYEYNAEPTTSVKVSMANFESISCVYEDSLMDFLSISVSAHANWPKDSYKTGFGLSFRL